MHNSCAECYYICKEGWCILSHLLNLERCDFAIFNIPNFYLSHSLLEDTQKMATA